VVKPVPGPVKLVLGSGQKLTLFNGDRAWDLSGGRPIPAGRRGDPTPGRR
jgi:hypothetical protein